MNNKNKLFKICSMIQDLIPNASSILKSKLLYFIQTYHLIAYGTPAFEEAIEAWMYGPAVNDAVSFFRYFNKKYDYSDLPKELRKIITDICDKLGNINEYNLVWYVMNLETNKKHWIGNQGYRYDIENYHIITNEEIKKYHKKLYEKTGFYFPTLKELKEANIGS